MEMGCADWTEELNSTSLSGTEVITWYTPLASSSIDAYSQTSHIEMARAVVVSTHQKVWLTLSKGEIGSLSAGGMRGATDGRSRPDL
jgi:hypothetical protein